jgi:glycosyltransferase involved in cell wall biosynthesis
MKCLMVHNSYQQAGGEDRVFEAEAALLEHFGHEVVPFTMHNDQVNELGRMELARATVWNRGSYREARAILQRERPAVLHAHNIFPLISPAIYYAAHAEGVPVVQTLHNYRLVCPDALLFRDGHVCEECLLKRSPISGIVHACYRNSRAATGVVAAMLMVHGALGTWTRLVDVFIALSDFSRDKYIQGGLPPGKIVVKPNFVYPDPGMREACESYALFVGRLTTDKGLRVLLAAWESLGSRIPLKIVGDGPLAEEVKDVAQRLGGVEWLGSQPRESVLALMKHAQFLVIPSLWYEAFGVVIAEAYGVGLPVIASNLGSMSTLIRAGDTGLHFRPGDVADLVAQVEWAIAHPAEMEVMGAHARREYETQYSADRNHDLLLQVYGLAIERAKRRQERRSLGRRL